jgi:hypothetical protein
MTARPRPKRVVRRARAPQVNACGPNAALNACVPAAPSTTVDGCDGVDNDCDGAVDEDCPACVHVAPNGDDAAALTDDNATPFASVQAAVDFASTHPSAPHRVCVAGGATCGDTATYDGPANADLTLRDGIDVFANYEATTWTRCSARTTTLAPQTPAGVVFPALESNDPVGVEYARRRHRYPLWDPRWHR